MLTSETSGGEPATRDETGNMFVLFPGALFGMAMGREGWLRVVVSMTAVLISFSQKEERACAMFRRTVTDCPGTLEDRAAVDIQLKTEQQTGKAVSPDG